MSGEEMERAIEIILNNQANYEIQFERTNRQIEQTNQQLAALAEKQSALATTQSVLTRSHATLAETQNEFMQVVTRFIETQSEVNASLRSSQTRTDDRLDSLINIVERFISEGRNG